MTRQEYFTSLATLALLASCASGPTTTTMSAEQDRNAYTAKLERSLTTYENRAAHLKGSTAADLRALLADTRAELHSMEVASNTSWQSYKPRLEDRISRIETKLKTAE